MSSHNTRPMRCPGCRSLDLTKTVRNGRMRCRQCGHGCSQEQAAKAAQRVVMAVTAKTDAPVNLAPMTYRQSIARQILAEHEAERQAVAGPRKPGRGRPVSVRKGMA